MPDDPIRQAGAIPYRRKDDGAVEVLLITTAAGTWSIPKGWIDAGKTAVEMAAIETLEEAGVTGATDDAPIGAFSYEKGGQSFHVEVYALRVEQVLETWDEQDVRRRRWVPIDEAISEVTYPGVSDLIRRLAADL